MKKKEVVMTIAIAVLLVLNIRTGYKLQELQNTLSSVKSSINHLHGSFGSIDSNIRETLADIRKEHMWIVDKDYDLFNVENKFEQAKITFNWTFRELGKNDKVYVLYGEENNRQVEKWNKLEPIPVDGLNYKGEVNLFYDKNYQFQVVAENSNSKKTEKLMNINLYDELMDRMDFEAYFPSMSHSEIEVYARIENFYRGLEALKIKRAKANIYYEGKVIKTINLTDIAKKKYRHGDIDTWEYENTFKFNDLFKNMTYSELEDHPKIQIIVQDYTGREYKSKLRDF
ncbi:hypothetical protein [Crassaminicella profunda]|uniref:hypothetical protein n=1 Tax=Crassaminicella profunda TaxID=1286698 RepID=UPI001CA724E7|nr:hypothetical protein [Crassaminicella profunda]QZY55786.1 hypothetical protein K7H06_01855 [Crassaminicella profunda]